MYSGAGKTNGEIALAMKTGIRSLNVESEHELEMVLATAAKLRRSARIAFRINPNVDAKTHPYIATGLHDTKFGLEIGDARRLAREVAKNRRVSLAGIASHIGSQIGDLQAVREAASLTAEFAKNLRKNGHASLTCIDLGGGWPIDYGDTPKCHKSEHSNPPPVRA